MSTVPCSTSTASFPAPLGVPAGWSLAEISAHLGHVPVDRIRREPTPGLATEADVVRLAERKEAACELVDGVLVEKTVGMYESAVAMAIGYFLMEHVRKSRSGVVLGERGPVRTIVPQVRMPDVCYVACDQFPGGKLPRAAVLPVAPALAVEILSAGNTPQEMARKLAEYFQAGTKLVWYIDPAKRTAQVYTSAHESITLDEAAGILTGGDVLPGFQVPLKEVFAAAGPFAE